MKKYIAAILLVVPLFAFAHTDGTPHHEITANTGFLQQIQQQLNASVTTQSTGTNLVGSLKARQKQLIELAKQSPATALRFVVPANTRSKQSVEAQKYIEQQGSISGTLEVIHVDDFDNPENSYFTYAVNNGGVKTNVYTVKEISSRSGTKVSLQGYKLNATEFLTDGKNVSLSAMPDVGALGKQRTLVLLVNSVAQPEQALTPKQAEDYINNGQFNKFIKEASYNQAWFEAKAYGWIQLSKVDRDGSCGFAEINDPEIKNFLSKNAISLSNFDRVLFLVPGGGGCSSVSKSDYTSIFGAKFSEAWIGINDYNSPSAWGQHSFPWSNLDFLLAHELGHSLGLWHANGFDCGVASLSGRCEHVEYGNNYDAMGSGGEFSLQYNGFYKEILGWIKSANILNITQSGRYTVGHLEFASPKIFAKVFNPKISATQPQFILESRYAVGFDESLAAGGQTKNAGILLTKPVNNESSRLIDTTPSLKDWWRDIADAAIKPGQTFVDGAGGLSIGQIVSQTATSTTFDVRVDQPTCIRSGGTVVSTQGDHDVSKGSQWYHNMKFINIDSDFCGASNMEFSMVLPTGWKLIRTAETVSVKPGAYAYLSFDISVPASAVSGHTNLEFYVTNKTTGVKTLAGRDYVNVVEPVVVLGVTPSPAKPGDTVTISLKNHNTRLSEVALWKSTLDFYVYKRLAAIVKDDSITFTVPTTVCVEREHNCVEESIPSAEYKIIVQGYGGEVEIPLYIGNNVPPPGTATSTIKNIKVVTNTTPALAYKYERYPITWEGTNLSRVSIDLYDFKGLYKIKTIKEDYDVTFSKDNQTFTYDWYVSGRGIEDDFYTIKVTDLLNKKVKSTSSKFEIKNYEAPTIGTAQVLGTSTIKLISTPDGRESSLVGSFEVKINATADTVNLPVYYGFYADTNKIAPPDKPGEYSSRNAPGKIESAIGDFTLVKNPKGEDIYRIPKGKSATFKFSAAFKPEEMFAGKYEIIFYGINAQSSQNKEAIITFKASVTPAITIIGEKAPYITSVNNPIKANLPAIIEGVRFSPTENILIVSGGQQYKLKGAVNNKITFIPSEIGLAPGEYGFQIDSVYGKSNYEWLDIKEATNAANIFTAVWDLISGWFKSKPKAAVPTANPVDVSTPSIKVVFPDKAEEWTVGKTYNIAFDVIGDVGTRIIRLNRYSDDGIRLGSEEIGTTMADSFSFTVPMDTPTTMEDAPKYKIEVLSSKHNDGMGVADESDTYFMIRSIEIVDF
jgi:hypothetical protein